MVTNPLSICSKQLNQIISEKENQICKKEKEDLFDIDRDKGLINGDLKELNIVKMNVS